MFEKFKHSAKIKVGEIKVGEIKVGEIKVGENKVDQSKFDESTCLGWLWCFFLLWQGLGFNATNQNQVL